MFKSSLLPLPPSPPIKPALNFFAIESCDSASLRSEATLRGEVPSCTGEFSALFLLLSTSLAIAISRSKPIEISSCILLASSPPDPLASPPLVLLAALVTSLRCFEVPGLGSGEPARFLSLSPGSGVCRLLLLPVDVGRDVEISGELNLPAKPSLEAAAFSFSKKLSNLLASPST